MNLNQARLRRITLPRQNSRFLPVAVDLYVAEDMADDWVIASGFIPCDALTSISAKFGVLYDADLAGRVLIASASTFERIVGTHGK